jgi:hypothetical protein
MLDAQTATTETTTATTEVATDFLKSKTGTLVDLDLGETSPVATEEAATPEAEATNNELSLQEQLELHDSLNPAADEATPADATPEDGAPDWTSEKLIKINTEFKEATGIDLKEGYDLIVEMRAELSAIKEGKQQETLQSAATKLQEAWGVNDAEVRRRASEVAAYAAKLPESMRQAIDNVDGIQLAWQHLQTSKANRQSRGKGGVETDGNTRSYSRKQVSDWMRNDPATYDLHAAGIAAARKAGRMTD